MLLTLGHSNMMLSSFLDFVQTAEVDGIVDVRSYPSSRRHPQFDGERLADELASAGIPYRWLSELGGFAPTPDFAALNLPNAESPMAQRAGWEKRAFLNYSFGTTRESWLRAVDDLIVEAGRRDSPRLAIMCAEVLWWRCHRSMISDYIVFSGFDVEHVRPAERRGQRILVVTEHSSVAGERLDRYHPFVIQSWTRWRQDHPLAPS